MISLECKDQGGEGDGNRRHGGGELSSSISKAFLWQAALRCFASCVLSTDTHVERMGRLDVALHGYRASIEGQ